MERLRVLTFNIWHRQGPWDRRLPMVQRAIKALAPDVIGFQEILHFEVEGGPALCQSDEIAAGLEYPHRAFASAWHVGGGLHFGNAILSRYPIVARKEWPLPAPEPDQARSLLYVVLDAPCGRIPFFVTHLAWRFEDTLLRQEQVTFIAARIAEECRALSSPFPAILVGDFNAEPESDEIRYLRGWHAIGEKTTCFYDAFAFAGDPGRGITFARRNPFARQANEPDRRIDYIFVQPPDRHRRGEILSARVVLDEPEDGVFASDHFGVYAELFAAPADSP
jgi:endonuclease/exonuclease/phosphatase family metal-dependent hydrolase